MRKETRAVKTILKHYFPEKTFKLKFKESYSYLDSSDKIIVFCPDEMDLDTVVSSLKRHTEGVRVYKKGEVVYAREADNVRFLIPETNALVDGELLEFIEVRYMSNTDTDITK